MIWAILSALLIASSEISDYPFAFLGCLSLHFMSRMWVGSIRGWWCCLCARLCSWLRIFPIGILMGGLRYRHMCMGLLLLLVCSFCSAIGVWYCSGRFGERTKGIWNSQLQLKIWNRSKNDHLSSKNVLYYLYETMQHKIWAVVLTARHSSETWISHRSAPSSSLSSSRSKSYSRLHPIKHT